MLRKSATYPILLGTTILASAAAAQDAADTYVLDPIFLSAGVEKVASSVPQSVSVVDAEGLEELAPGSIGDVLATVPGVAGVGSSSFFGQGFNIRGFGSSGSAASEAGIIQMIDGEEKYYESYRQGSLFVEPDFLKRVEVLRGPGASTLYGSGALGGIISMETIDAADLIPEGETSGGRVKLGYASNPDTALGSIAWGWRPVEDLELLAAFAYRSLGESEDSDGDTIVRSNSDTPNLLLKARKTFGEHYVELSYQHLEAKGEDQDFNQLEGAQIGAFGPFFPGWGVGDITTRDQVARLEWGWNPADNRYIDAKVTLSYTNTIKDVKQGDNADEPIMGSLLGRREYALWRLRGQNTADLSGAGYSHFLTVGAETFRQDRTSTTTSSSHPEGYTRSAAVFAWSELEWNRLTVNSGLRYQKQRTEPKDSVTVSDERVDAESVEPQVGVMYRLNDDWSVFGSIAFVKRMPTVDELYDGFGGGAASPDLKDEKGKNIEVGLSYRSDDIFMAGDEAAMKLTLFRNHIDDMIMRTNMPAPEPSYVNIDRAYLRGGELEASYLTGGWQFGAAVSVVDGEDQDGEVLDTLPNDRVVLSASWQASDSWKLGARSILAKGREKPDDSHRGGYGVHDIYAIWTPQQGALQGVSVNMGVDNVANRDYTPATYLTGPAPGRNFKISLSRRF
ncbi:TonB-dependent receptor domain-containing protein [Paracoccus xiamenensis]|uniref:TonB-dependent receptor domain-containing protein n=1 Tax=Paracoccus xiamenensis TaxID=2714901 RepID=UPI0014072E37|nr:TonB-dependent receptor [Paracoccus xiamenensis]NHF72031.1 TonB-dependent receptor [Paracoccus xiamenensis]